MNEWKKDMNNENRGELAGDLGLAVEAMRTEPPPSHARQRVIDAAASWTPASIAERSRRRMPPVVAVLVAASLLLAVSVGVYLATLVGRAKQVAVNTGPKTVQVVEFAMPGSGADGSASASTDDDVAQGASSTQGNGSRFTTQFLQADSRPRTTDGATPSYLNAVVAESAPIMLANGRGETIALGAWMPGLKSREGAVHMWDWSQSPQSRVVKASRPLTTYVALSADGRYLVWADGNVLDLVTGQRSSIDLGWSKYEPRIDWGQGITRVRFSPDGGRLAVLVGSRADDGTRRGEVQIFEFPTGKRLCQFPAVQPSMLRIGFSPDGRQVVTGDAARRILRRDATSGEILASYEPPLDNFMRSAALSPAGRFVAATTQRKGDLLVWEADTGRLAYMHAGLGVGCLKFSPDGTLLAVAVESGMSGSDITVYDAATGRVQGEIKPRWLPTPTVVQWSADGKVLTVVSACPSGTEGGRNIYPSVREWDWKSGRLLRSLDESASGKDKQLPSGTDATSDAESTVQPSQNREVPESGRIEARVAFPELRLGRVEASPKPPDDGSEGPEPTDAKVFRVASIRLSVLNPANQQWEKYDQAPPDTLGAFVFEDVPSGTVELMPMFEPYGFLFGLKLPAEVVAGETTKVTFGGKGRPVVGKVDLPEALKTARGRIRVRIYLEAPPFHLEIGPSGAGRVPFWDLYGAVPESQRDQGPLPIDAKGRFRFDAVSPGNYFVQIYIPGKLRPDGDSKALRTRKFTVPLTPSQTPLDLDILAVQAPEDDRGKKE